MAQIVNDNKLNLILTDFGKERIAYAVENPTVTLNITKIKLGSGDNHEYYVPDSSQTELKGSLGLEFYIYDKALLEDNLTISFHTVIPEDIGGFDIREVGLYETYEGEDRLFAISTQQPFVKPSSDDFYFINVDYYLFLKATNFADVYDRITLDTEHALITDVQLEELIRTFLFAQSNLMNQIGNNSTIIGYNRATQLYQKIRENRRDYSYITLYKNYAALTDIVSSIDNIFSYWAFEYSRRKEEVDSIVDLSPNGYYLSTSNPISEFEREYRGFTSMFTFNTPKSFNLSSQIPLDLVQKETIEGITTIKDAPFSMAFVIEPLDTTTDRTLLAKSDYALGLHTIEVMELTDMSLQVRLFSDAANYKTFKTVAGSVPTGAHAIAFSYFPSYNEGKLFVYINSTKYIVDAVVTGDNYKHMSEEPGIMYAFECAPYYSIFTDNLSEPTKLYTQDSNGFISEYEGDEWFIQDNEIYYKTLENKAIVNYQVASTEHLYNWIPPDVASTDMTVYTTVNPNDPEKAVINPDGSVTFFQMPTLYNANYSVYSPSEEEFRYFTTVAITTGYQIKFVREGTFYDAVHDPDEQSKDIFPINVYGLTYTMEMDTIYTNSIEEPTVLYLKNNESFSVYVGDEWTILDSKIYKLGFLAEYNEAKNVETPGLDLTSYIIGSDGYPINHINSNAGIISVIREGLSDEELKILVLNLCASLGRNPYFGD